MEVKEFLRMYWPYILITTVSLLTLNILGINFDPIKSSHIEKVVTIENFYTKPNIETLPKSFNYDLNKSHLTCKELSDKSCRNTSFCVLLDHNKCVGGNDAGPTYITQNNKPVSYSSYIHKETCYGQC